eukprot:TRINITY_DN8119_c0_g1_i2.p1 TRINITY_DN8119_c0_g1~~TRINITY_DN8119_c0_g1_i2.p1  ORF type:complete len:503 (-),score=118.16 TRINITY_DN8119_c0_g1_i2:58-1566(-)
MFGPYNAPPVYAVPGAYIPGQPGLSQINAGPMLHLPPHHHPYLQQYWSSYYGQYPTAIPPPSTHGFNATLGHSSKQDPRLESDGPNSGNEEDTDGEPVHLESDNGSENPAQLEEEAPREDDESIPEISSTFQQDHADDASGDGRVETNDQEEEVMDQRLDREEDAIEGDVENESNEMDQNDRFEINTNDDHQDRNFSVNSGSSRGMNINSNKLNNKNPKFKPTTNHHRYPIHRPQPGNNNARNTKSYNNPRIQYSSIRGARFSGGRRGSSRGQVSLGYRTSVPRGRGNMNRKPREPDWMKDDFDFEKNFEKFNYQQFAEELDMETEKLKHEIASGGSPDISGKVKHEEIPIIIEKAYDKETSFYDGISCETQEKLERQKEGKKDRGYWNEQRKKELEKDALTFGFNPGMRSGFYNNNNNNNGHHMNNAGNMNTRRRYVANNPNPSANSNGNNPGMVKNRRVPGREVSPSMGVNNGSSPHQQKNRRQQQAKVFRPATDKKRSE